MRSYEFGRMLQAYRKQHQLTIREFSMQTGLSASRLSELERGIGNPTLLVLETLADAMGLPLETLLRREIPNADLVQRRGQRALAQIPGSHHLYNVLAVNPVRSQLQMLLLDLAPGEVSNDAPSVHPYTEEIAYVVQGTVLVRFDAEELSLAEGDTIRILPGRRHLFFNFSSAPAKIIFAQAS